MSSSLVLQPAAAEIAYDAMAIFPGRYKPLVSPIKEV